MKSLIYSQSLVYEVTYSTKMFSWDFIVLLAIGSCFVISTRAGESLGVGGESQEVGGEAKRVTENEVDDEKKEEETRKSLQPQREDKKGETDWATQSYQANTKLIARLSVTVAQLEEGMREMEKKTLENEIKMMENEMKMEKKMMENEMKMEKEKKVMRKSQLENQKEINNLHLQLKNVRQHDQIPTGPLAPLETFLTKIGINVKNNTRRIAALEKSVYNLTFGGNCTIPYGHKLIPLQPYLTTKSAYGIYPVTLGWDAARQACLAHSAELASMETEGEWRFVYGQLVNKSGHDNHWIGGSKAGPAVGGIENHKGFKWLTGKSIPANDIAWCTACNYGGRCLIAFGPGNLADSSWADFDCERKLTSVCEYKMKE